MFNNIKKILITGCGGDIGISIGKILKSSFDKITLIGTDLYDDYPAHTLCDHMEIVPRANEADYLEKLQVYTEKNKPDLIIPSTEEELSTFYKNDISSNFEGIPIIMASKKALELGLDKLATNSFLQENNLPAPWTELGSNNPFEIPCIHKERMGHGSQSVHLVRDKESANYYKKKGDTCIWQEHIIPADQEYTCGLFRSSQGETREIIFKRKLVGGITGSGELVQNKEISELLKSIAEKLDLVGSINIQLRLSDKGPMVFEINARFSSTVYFRHLMGFEDLLWSIQDRLKMKLSSYSPPQNGLRFYRMSDEVIVAPKN